MSMSLHQEGPLGAAYTEGSLLLFPLLLSVAGTLPIERDGV